MSNKFLIEQMRILTVWKRLERYPASVVMSVQELLE